MDPKSKFMNTYYDSDDEELPSLSARIQNACKLTNDMQAIALCANESTPSQKNKVCENIENTPKFNNFEIKDPSAMESIMFSESEDESKFLNFLEEVKAAPRSKRSPLPLVLNLSSDSEDDYPFCLAKPAENFFTPVPQKRSIPVKISASAQKYSSNGLKERNSELLPTSKRFLQPKAPCKLNITPTPEERIKISLYSDSEDESDFLKFVQAVRQTPCSVKKFASDQVPVSNKNYPSNVLKEKNSGQSNARITSSRCSSSSEDESEFERFVETIRQTPHSTKKKHLSPAVKNNHNDLLANVIKSLQRIQSSKSEVSSVSVGSTSDCPEKMKLFASPCTVSTKKISTSWFNGITISKAWTAAQKENAENYSKLFTGEPKFCISFPRCRDIVAQKLYSFFNKTVFDSKLPDNLPLIWSNKLTNSAGMFCVKSSKGSFIQLSLPFLTSLDRLQDTLIHEMCHAAVYFISKTKRECHGPLWQIWASRCNLILPFIKCPKRCHNYDIVK